MIKIRLHGEKQEIEKVSKAIKEQFNVLNVSHLYKDRGESVYYRAYIDAELKESKTLQGLVCCDRNPDKADCIECPYLEEKGCQSQLLFDCKDYIRAQICKENQK